MDVSYGFDDADIDEMLHLFERANVQSRRKVVEDEITSFVGGQINVNPYESLSVLMSELEDNDNDVVDHEPPFDIDTASSAEIDTTSSADIDTAFSADIHTAFSADTDTVSSVSSERSEGDINIHVRDGLSSDDEGEDEEAELLLECQICFSTYRISQGEDCVECGVNACEGCLQSHIQTQVKDGNFEMDCPGAECTRRIPGGTILQSLDEVGQTRYKRFLADKDPRKKKCPRCGFPKEIGDLLLEEKGIGRVGLKVACQSCGVVWCFLCHAPWHAGITCKDYLCGDDLMRKWADQKTGIVTGCRNAVLCPKCSAWIQKASGCDHMKCTKCKKEFCYRCRGSWMSNGHTCRFTPGFSIPTTRLGYRLRQPFIRLKNIHLRKRINKKLRRYEKCNFSTYNEKENNLKSVDRGLDRFDNSRLYTDLYRSTYSLYSYTIFK